MVFPFDIIIAKDGMNASLFLKDSEAIHTSVTVNELRDWLMERNVCFGLQEEILQVIAEDPLLIEYPVIVAQGLSKQNGTDAYLLNETTAADKKKEPFNFKNILNIPSVKSGQLLARIIPPTPGSDGIDIHGKTIPTKPGRPLKLKPGKNVMFHLDCVYATTDGQVSISPREVNVFPVFEVKGDLNMKTGNIDFIGNVLISGNISSGYQVKAGGDIKVNGLVEGAKLEAGGSIYISGGIAGGEKAIVTAGVDIHTRYINQAQVIAGNDVIVDTYVMHSNVQAGGNFVNKKGNLIGGKFSVGKSIIIDGIGNKHFARTELYLGILQKDLELQLQLQQELKETLSSLEKLYVLHLRLKQKQEAGILTAAEQSLWKKQITTSEKLMKKRNELETELLHFNESEEDFSEVSLKAAGTVFPNSKIFFGKYSKLFQHASKGIKVSYHEGEIITIAL